jgi:3'-phosphoadenosine 5'-phosphosulfate sulfotransferase (PAPS reductase)/FAD synthetase
LASTLARKQLKGVAFYSGGEASWAAAKRWAANHGAENLTLLFTDTRMEGPDLYRFLQEGAENIGAPLVWLKDGRDIWQVFDDEKMLGNSGKDPCSKVLKRKPAQKWLKENCDPAETELIFGLDWSEFHRFDAPPKNGRTERSGVKNVYARLGWPHVVAPLCDPPYLTRRQIGRWVEDEGMKRPKLYLEGFSHNNCGGGCVKAGKGHWAHLLKMRPETYAVWEAGEIAFNAKRPGKPFQTILQIIQQGRPNMPISLTELRERVQTAPQTIDMFEIGGCGCFVEDEAETV